RAGAQLRIARAQGPREPARRGERPRPRPLARDRSQCARRLRGSRLRRDGPRSPPHLGRPARRPPRSRVARAAALRVEPGPRRGLRSFPWGARADRHRRPVPPRARPRHATPHGSAARGLRRAHAVREHHARLRGRGPDPPRRATRGILSPPPGCPPFLDRGMRPRHGVPQALAEYERRSVATPAERGRLARPWRVRGPAVRARACRRASPRRRMSSPAVLRSGMAARTLRPEDLDRSVPIYVVWETTLRCDHACAHCGSRAGDAREDELETAELLAVADALARLGTREVTLIGGEAYLRGDVYELIAHLAGHGIRVTMQTGGRGLTATRCRKLAEAGLAAIGVSIDGPAEVHDVLRASPGSHAAALAGVAHAREAGLLVTSNTQVNRLNRGRLRETAALLEAAGVQVWRAQMTAPMGNAADRPDWILQPYMI